MIRIAGLFAIWLLLTAATEPMLVPDVSAHNIDIRYSFHGSEEILFGAIVYPDGVVPEGKIDIAVVLRGPSQSIRVREKQKLAGLMWANADDTRFRSAPAYYAISSTRPLKDIVDERTSDIYELGLGSLQLSPASGMTPEAARRFEAGLIDLRTRGTLYATHPGTVTISQGVLYSARLDIPARVPVGHYTAETFLIRKGHVIAAATTDVEIHKTGFERFVALAALYFPFTYGVVVIALSVLLGWGAGQLFKRV